MAESSTEPRVVVIDKDGDTILTLKGPIQELKDWKSDWDSNSDADSSTNSDTETNGGTYSDSDSDLYSDPEVKPTGKVERIAVAYYQVSSKLLRPASQYFHRMFSRGFSETIPCPDDGKYHITAEGFDPDALEHVLKVVHLKDQRLPDTIGLYMLAYIAVIVDYYDMYEAVVSQTEIWASVVAIDSFPTTFCRAIVRRAFVSKTFGDGKDFRRGALFIVLKGEGQIPDVGIPTLGVAELLDNLRLRAIQAMVDKIKEVPSPGSIEWRSYSELTRDMLDKCDNIRFSGKRIHRISPPFQGVSYQELKWKVSKCTVMLDCSYAFTIRGLVESEAEETARWELYFAKYKEDCRPQDLLLAGIERAASIAWE